MIYLEKRNKRRKEMAVLIMKTMLLTLINDLYILMKELTERTYINLNMPLVMKEMAVLIMKTMLLTLINDLYILMKELTERTYINLNMPLVMKELSACKNKIAGHIIKNLPGMHHSTSLSFTK